MSAVVTKEKERERKSAEDRWADCAPQTRKLGPLCCYVRVVYRLYLKSNSRPPLDFSSKNTSSMMFLIIFHAYSAKFPGVSSAHRWIIRIVDHRQFNLFDTKRLHARLLLYDAILYNFRDCWKSKRARPPALPFIGHESGTIVRRSYVSPLSYPPRDDSSATMRAGRTRRQFENLVCFYYMYYNGRTSRMLKRLFRRYLIDYIH
ncbi:unnamed protein product [Trichogramma brassicae]|uniref:Uncharacterized protein n=1 Tax=Trichogramma brassicae TaxID=86971 RepID=A0A6H5IC18_9HYME|nr:unnamed protein product [Trichogramma brassicae]